MKVSNCTHRPVLVSCDLKNFEYQIDPYIGCEHYCYYCYVLNQAETDWTREILIHEDITGQMSAELDQISPQRIYMGYYSDPYQPCEAECRQTREVLKLLSEKGFSASILTKSDLVVRDLDVLTEMDHPTVGVSVAFNDNHIRRKFETNTVDNEARIDALCKLRKEGIETYALICPIIPYITDVMLLINMLESHTARIWVYGLSINESSDRNWQNVQEILYKHFPNSKKQIEAAIFDEDHPYWVQLRQDLTELQKDRQLNLSIHV